MAQDPPKIDLHRRLPALEHLPKVERGPERESPLRGPLKQVVDRYNPSILNRVMQGLKALLTLKPDRAFELAVKREGKQVTAGSEKEELSLFEKIFLARFEGGVELGEKLEQGKAKFLAKTEEAWVEFFQKFLPFTLEKKGKVADLEALIYRGLLQQAGTKEKGTLISDIKFLDGQMDKFARLEIQGSSLLTRIASMMPGDLLAQALLAEWIGGPEFAYRALSHRVVNPEMMKSPRSPIAESYQSPEKMKEEILRQGVRDESPGIALSARTEQLIAERLNLDLRAIRGDAVLNSRPRETATAQGSGLGGLFFKKRKRGIFGGFFDQEGDTGPVFVPWFQQLFRPKKISGRPRWWVPLLYFTAFSAAALFVFYIFKFLLQR